MNNYIVYEPSAKIREIAREALRDSSTAKINPTDSRFSLDLWDFSFCPFF